MLSCLVSAMGPVYSYLPRSFLISHCAIKHLNILQLWWEGALKFYLRSLSPPYDFLSDTSVSKHLISCWCAAVHVEDVADTVQPPHHLWFHAWTLPVMHKAELLAFTWGLQSFCRVQQQKKLFVTWWINKSKFWRWSRAQKWQKLKGKIFLLEKPEFLSKRWQRFWANKMCLYNCHLLAL